MADFQPPYMDYSDMAAGSDYFDAKSDVDTMPPPSREKFEEAFQTVKDYMKNPASIEDVPIMMSNKDFPSATPATTTTTTTPTPTTPSPATSTTTTTQTTTTTEGKSSAFSSTTPTSTSTLMTSSSASVVATPEKKKSSHRKKPLSSFDNDTEADVTLRTVFNNYGVSQENIGFILDASYCLIVTGTLLLW